MAAHEGGGQDLKRFTVMGGAQGQRASGVGLRLRQVRVLRAADRSALEMETSELGVIPCGERVPRDPRFEEVEIQLQDFSFTEAGNRGLGSLPSAAQREGSGCRAQKRQDKREPAERGS